MFSLVMHEGYGNIKAIHNSFFFSAMIASFRNEINETKLNKTKKINYPLFSVLLKHIIIFLMKPAN